LIKYLIQFSQQLKVDKIIQINNKNNMAKSYKYATEICVALTVLALIGIVIGIAKSSPLIAIIFLLPAVIYEVYRTEGKSTKWASIVLLVVFIAEFILIITNVSFDLAGFLGATEKCVAGYAVPLGDIKIVGPGLMAVLALILLIRTRGRYTKWLAIIIIITSLAIAYILDPAIFTKFLRLGIQEGLKEIR